MTRSFDPRLAPGQVELEPSDAHGRRVLAPSVPQVDADAGDELVERERLRQVVVRPQLKAAELRRQVGPGGEDQHRQLGSVAVELVEHAQAVEPGQLQIEDDELVGLAEGEREPGDAVLGAVDGEPFRFEPYLQEPEDARLVFDDQDPHGRACRP